MHGKFLTLLNPNNGYLQYNLHFYMLLVGCIKNMSEVQVRKDIMKVTGQSCSANILKWQKARSGERMLITYKNLIVLCDYFNRQIPYLNLNSDDMLTSNNERAKERYLSNTEITPQSLGLSK